MAVKIKLTPHDPDTRHPTRRRVLWIVLGIIVACCIFGACVFGYYYVKYGRIVSARLERPLFMNTAKVYAAPEELRPGQTFTPGEVANVLNNAGYSVVGASPVSQMGTYSITPSSITVHPGPLSAHAPDSATVSFANGVINQITGDNGQQVAAYDLEPVLITDLSGPNRSKRRLLTWDQIPKVVVQAVTAIEDHRYFEHGAVDYYAIAAWSVHDLLHDRRYTGGASTLTMQFAKEFFLTPQRTLKRKVLQVIVAMQLEHHLTKQQIFALYANEVPLGERGSFSVNGFGEAAHVFFNERVDQLTAPQAALLAGLIQSPSWLNPYRHPHRAMVRRNVVLDAMAEAGDITDAQAEAFKATPLGVVQGPVDAGEAPYFVDMVRDQLASRLGDNYNRRGLRIYTSLDPNLQRAAAEAVAEGMKNVDAIVEKRHAWRVRHGDKSPLVLPQVALVALNPHTGQVLALVGGTNYGKSQLNHALASRPTASTFKPFVYAAAFNTSITGVPLTSSSGTTGIFTQSTILDDEPTVFTFGNGQTYAPRNFENEYMGPVTARTALQFSLNNATISLAQMVGYGNVAALARSAGITSVRPTPAMAIGAYDSTPLQMAGAYTTFANHGVFIHPWMVASVRNSAGDVMDEYTPVSKPLLDPRVAYLTVALMENVINHGTGATVRARGFTAPAAGKTGTENDSWFDGFTSNLLCVVWVGNNNYSDLGIQGANAAAPIWADFMKRAQKLPEYSDMEPFTPPPGVVEVTLDKSTNLLADTACPDDYTAAFLDGTQPTDTCDHSGGNQRSIFQKLFGIGEKSTSAAAPTATPPSNTAQPAETRSPETRATPKPEAQAAPVEAEPTKKKKKRGFFSRIFGLHSGSSQSNQPSQPDDSNGPQNQ